MGTVFIQHYLHHVLRVHHLSAGTAGSFVLTGQQLDKDI